MNRILSTKKLKPQHRQWLLNAGLTVVDADFIRVKHKPLPELVSLNESLLFTSQNAVNAVLQSSHLKTAIKYPCLCVGEKTAELLIQNGFQVLHQADYAEDLATMLIQKKYSKSITFFSGNLRRDILPEVMNRLEVCWNEYEVYETIQVPVSVPEIFDGILFFSPSGVESFHRENKTGGAVCFSIGTTTASALRPYTNKIITADKPTVENAIVRCIQYFKNNPEDTQTI